MHNNDRTSASLPTVGEANSGFDGEGSEKEAIIPPGIMSRIRGSITQNSCLLCLHIRDVVFPLVWAMVNMDLNSLQADVGIHSGI